MVQVVDSVEDGLDRQLLSAARVVEGADVEVGVDDCAVVDDDVEVDVNAGLDRRPIADARVVEAGLDRRQMSSDRVVEGADLGVEVDAVDCAVVDVEVDVEAGLNRWLISAARVVEGAGVEVDVDDCAVVDDDVEVDVNAGLDRRPIADARVVEAGLDRRQVSSDRVVEGADFGVEVDIVDCAVVDVEVGVDSGLDQCPVADARVGCSNARVVDSELDRVVEGADVEVNVDEADLGRQVGQYLAGRAAVDRRRNVRVVAGAHLQADSDHLAVGVQGGKSAGCCWGPQLVADHGDAADRGRVS